MGQILGDAYLGGLYGTAAFGFACRNIVPVGRVTPWRMEQAGRFPKGTYISPNRRVWFEDEIIAWQNAVDEFDPNRRRGKGRART